MTTHRNTTTLPLERTHKQTAFNLDFASHTAMHYAQAWAVSRGGRKPHLSAIARRALVAYARHLEGIETTARTQQTDRARVAELRALRSSSSGTGALTTHHGLMTEAQAQARALERLTALHASGPQSTAEGTTWPTFGDLLHGPEVEARSRAFVAAVNASTEEHLDAIHSSAWGRLKGLS
jgi:hypothetical protein